MFFDPSLPSFHGVCVCVCVCVCVSWKGGGEEKKGEEGMGGYLTPHPFLSEERQEIVI